ncbi:MULTISPECIES: SAM-dependent methyltransferase [Streptomyces]|uniref:SAM-dependent methyltransferase n=1 Tax=Streptomyces lycii TaxID=2654337 RepID=A0ABQ7FQZ6_9ACTN|nr:MULTISPECIES: SAM-dependent methyltransferase [Streptomyces]KAF4410894.1 SAM-dependent methyltransferase [Streptomyces lycii]PGH52565.1 SAM-dependent methyltransferase [Streptomyces sp. Ru87]
MTPTLVRQHQHLAPPAAHGHRDAYARARDWAEIQERMLVPLYEAVYARLEIGTGDRLLGLGCGSGLALLMAAARGASVTGTDTDGRRLALAEERLRPGTAPHGSPADGPRVVGGGPAAVAAEGGPRFTAVTAFDPQSGADGELVPMLTAAAALAERGSPVVIAGWGPPERCATASVLRAATRQAARPPDLGPGYGSAPGGWRPYGRDALEEAAHRAGLRPDGSGRLSCPFGYADPESAVRGLLSTGLFDAAAEAADEAQVEKELAEALHPYVRRDGTVWMPNVFRYLIARV